MTRQEDEYARLNTLWPSELPPLTPAEARSAAKRLYRRFHGRPFTGKIQITSGNRRSWLINGRAILNPAAGWKSFCHDLSHDFHRILHPQDRPHGPRHLDLEFAVVRHVKELGWLEGKLKRPLKPRSPENIRQLRYSRVLLRLEAWHRKLKRAKTAILKLERQRRYYEKALSATTPVGLP